jgi:hypothetical protein
MATHFPKVEPHGSIQEIFTDVYVVTGSVQFKPLLRLPRNMIILRNGEELTLVNTVRLDESGEAALDALGLVKNIMKIGFHGMDDDYYMDRYQPTRWSIADANGATANSSDVALSESTPLPVPQARAFLFRETVLPEAAILLERDGGLLITCDSVQHWAPHNLMSPVAKLVTRLMGFQHPAQIGPPWRGKQTRAEGSLRPDFERILELPFKHIIGGHGGLLRNDGPARLRETIGRVYGD